MRHLDHVIPAAAVLTLAALLFLARVGGAQTLQPNQWETYTSMRSASDVALSADSLHAWVATDGGAFEVDIRFPNSSLRALRTTDGLSENDLTAVAADRSGNIYFGGATGGFDVYHTTSGTIDQLGADIRGSSFTNKAINGIAVFGSKVYLATAYGLTVYNSADSAFDETATQIAGLPTNDSIRAIFDDGNFIYGAMAEGVVFARVGSDLHAGINWTLLPDSGGAVRALVRYQGAMYAGARNGLFVVSAAQHSLTPVPGAPTDINRLIVAHDSLVVLDESGNTFTTLDLQNFSKQSLNAGSTVVAIAPDTLGGLVQATDANGASLPSGDSNLSNIFPPGPIISQTQTLYFSTFKDELYATHLNAGFDAFHPSSDRWSDFPAGVGSTPGVRFLTPFYDSIRDELWLEAEGPYPYRVQALESGNPIWSQVDSGQISPYDASGYTRAEGIMIDQQGNIVITAWAGDGRGLAVSGDGVNFTRYSLQPSGSQSWNPVTQDLDGNYWVGTCDNLAPLPVGVYWVRKSDGVSGIIPGGPAGTLGPSLAGTQSVNALLTDQDGAVWCGTSAGIEIISNPYAIEQPDPVFSIRSVPFVANQYIHTMATDGVGNKWIGTDNGIFVVSPDGADSVARITKQNSPLVDNAVISLAIDPLRGEVYAGTPSGISRFSTIYRQGNSGYTAIHVYPNPVVETSEGSQNVYIDGLVAGSTVQIFSIGGRLINTINGTALGSTVKWNGLDAHGRLVPSGMYLISATSAQTGENGEAKVVIVRKP